MKRTQLISTLACLIAIAGMSRGAFARGRMYHPGFGRFMQRDPIGTATAPPMARNLSASQFTQRDPTVQYTDGPNLYQYVGSNPARHRDPSGLKINHYDCCTDAQKTAIKAAHDAAEKKLKTIKKAIEKYTYDWVLQNYVLEKNRETGGMSRHDEQTVWTNYRRNMQVNIAKMQNKFSSGIGVTCEKECDKGTIAYVNAIVLYGSYGDIHFCPPYFKDSASSQASAFLHELSHLAADTDDRALNWNREAGWFTTGGWYAKDAADDAYWFGGCASSLYDSSDLYRSHEVWIWSEIWPKAK